MCRARNGNGISSGASTGGNTISCGRGLPAAWNVNSRHTRLDCDSAWTYCVLSHTHMRAHEHTNTCTQGTGLAVSHHGSHKQPAHITHRLYLDASTEMCSNSAESDRGLEKSMRSSLTVRHIQDTVAVCAYQPSHAASQILTIVGAMLMCKWCMRPGGW